MGYDTPFKIMAFVCVFMAIVFASLKEVTPAAIMWACVVFMYWEAHRKH